MSMEVIRARTALLDALDALSLHRSSIILVGAQAIYLRTGAADVALAEFTTDADLAVDPRALMSNPRIEEAMAAADFIRDPANVNPGAWISPDGIPVDLMVPDLVAGKGRRGVTVGSHARGAMRRAPGLEAVLVDNGMLPVDGLQEGDERRIDVRVAGLAGLLIAKLHKMNDRLGSPSRRSDKDAHDIYRILVAADTGELANTCRMLLLHELCHAVSSSALNILAELFADRPDAPGSAMAGRAERAIGDPELVSVAASLLAADLLSALDR